MGTLRQAFARIARGSISLALGLGLIAAFGNATAAADDTGPCLQCHSSCDDFERAGNPQCVAGYARPSNSSADTGDHVGGGSPFRGQERRVGEGTWGWDYAGALVRTDGFGLAGGTASAIKGARESIRPTARGSIRPASSKPGGSQKAAAVVSLKMKSCNSLWHVARDESRIAACHPAAKFYNRLTEADCDPNTRAVRRLERVLQKFFRKSCSPL